MFSIIAGTLNRRKLLEPLLENTLYASDLVELILVDGGSTDGTVEYLSDINHERFKFIPYGKRSYYPEFMNLALKECSNPYIVQWNDDVLLENTWEDIAKCIEPMYDLYNFPYRQEKIDPLKIGKSFHRSSCMNYPYMLRDYCINFGIFSKKCIDDIGGYDTRIKWHHGDAELTARAISRGYQMKCCKNISVVEVDIKKNINRVDTPQMSNDSDILKKLLLEYNINVELYFRYVSDGKGLTVR